MTDIQPVRLTRPLPCGATRPPLSSTGWECTGRDLTVVMWHKTEGENLPCVYPTERIREEGPRPDWTTNQPFAGGDHLHVAAVA